jgi:hypothetical protein
MAEHHEPETLSERYKKMVVRGVAAALLLAILSIAEYVLAGEIDNPTWAMVPFMVVKGWVILDTFMHVRALRNEGAH